MSEETRISVYDGKYTFIKNDDDYRVHCLRYNEPWMTFEHGCRAISSLMYVFEQLQVENENLKETLRKINDWCRAYPLEVFPKPDKEYFKQAHKILADNGLSLTRISADNMRHVLEGIKDIISETKQ